MENEKYWDSKELEKNFLNKRILIVLADGYNYKGILSRVFVDGLLLDEKTIIPAHNVVSIHEIKNEVVEGKEKEIERVCSLLEPFLEFGVMKAKNTEELKKLLRTIDTKRLQTIWGFESKEGG